jgi:rare lipoprotein A
VLNREHLQILALLIATSIFCACGSRGPADGPPRSSNVPRQLPGDATPKEEPRSRYGNGPYYRVGGKTYKVMESSSGYHERGVASWYGKKFHGRMTSTQEPYDMYAMTAAHKTLPLPSYVRVRNLKNNRSVIVRVNDRGPFVDNRLIDLSYSAALKLDMIRNGTGLVEVTAISFDSPPPRIETSTDVSDRQAKPDTNIYVQVGAFGELTNARRRFALLRNGGIGSAFIRKDSSSSQTLYRVRIGPIADVTQYDSIVAELQRLGITETHLVTE